MRCSEKRSRSTGAISSLPSLCRLAGPPAGGAPPGARTSGADPGQLDLDAECSAGAMPVLQTLLAEDPTIEEAHRAVMRACAAAGQRDRALRQYDRCRAALATELQAEPAAETTALRDEIAVARPSPAREAAPAVRPETATASTAADPADTAGRQGQTSSKSSKNCSPEPRRPLSSP